MIDTILEYYRKIDIIGPKIGLESSNSTRYKTFTGATSSLIIYIIVLVSAIKIASDAWKHEKPNVTNQNISLPYTTIQLSDLSLSFKIYSSSGVPIKNPSSYIYFETNEAKTDEENNILIIYNKYSVSECKDDIEYSLCLNSNNGTISNEVYSVNSTSLRMNLYKCDSSQINSSNKCADDIEDTFNSLYLTINYQSSYYNIQSFHDPIFNVSAMKFFPLSDDLFKNIKISFYVGILSTNKGWLFDNYQDTHFIQLDEFDTNYGSIDNSSDNPLLQTLQFTCSKIVPKVIRTYTLITDIFSKVGGMATALTVILELIFYHFLRFSYLMQVHKFSLTILNESIYLPSSNDNNRKMSRISKVNNQVNNENKDSSNINNEASIRNSNRKNFNAFTFNMENKSNLNSNTLNPNLMSINNTSNYINNYDNSFHPIIKISNFDASNNNSNMSKISKNVSKISLNDEPSSIKLRNNVNKNYNSNDINIGENISPIAVKEGNPNIKNFYIKNQENVTENVNININNNIPTEKCIIDKEFITLNKFNNNSRNIKETHNLNLFNDNSLDINSNKKNSIVKFKKNLTNEVKHEDIKEIINISNSSNIINSNNHGLIYFKSIASLNKDNNENMLNNAKKESILQVYSNNNVNKDNIYRKNDYEDNLSPITLNKFLSNNKNIITNLNLKNQISNNNNLSSNNNNLNISKKESKINSSKVNNIFKLRTPNEEEFYNYTYSEFLISLFCCKRDKVKLYFDFVTKVENSLDIENYCRVLSTI